MYLLFSFLFLFQPTIWSSTTSRRTTCYKKNTGLFPLSCFVCFVSSLIQFFFLVLEYCSKITFEEKKIIRSKPPTQFLKPASQIPFFPQYIQYIWRKILCPPSPLEKNNINYIKFKRKYPREAKNKLKKFYKTQKERKEKLFKTKTTKQKWQKLEIKTKQKKNIKKYNCNWWKRLKKNKKKT